MDFFHHVDVVQAVHAVPAPAHVLEGTGHIFLPVEIVGLESETGEPVVGIGDHGGDIFGGGQILPALKKISTLFQSQGMDGDIGGIQFRYPVQAAAEAVDAVGGKTGDQIHINGGKTRILRFPEGTDYIRCFVRTAAGPEDMISHGLGVDAHAVGTMLPDGPELFGGEGIRTAAFHGKFNASGKVEMLTDGIHQPNHLLRGQGGGGTAADIDGADGFTGLPQELAADGDLLQKRV